MKSFKEFLDEGKLLYGPGSERYQEMRQEMKQEHKSELEKPEVKCKSCGWEGMVHEVEKTKGSCPECKKENIVMAEETQKYFDPTAPAHRKVLSALLSKLTQKEHDEGKGIEIIKKHDQTCPECKEWRKRNK